MSKATGTILSLVAGVLLFSASMTAQTSSNSTDDKNGGHHSRLSKVAFWRHHKDGDKSTNQTKQAPSKQAQSKTAQAKTAQVKPVSAKQSTGNAEPKPKLHASTKSDASAKKTSVKAPAAHTTKPPKKSQDQTASSKQ